MSAGVGEFGDKTKTLEDRLGGARTAGFAMSAAGTVITGTLLAAAKSAADFGSELWDMHTRTGASVESLSALKYAAEQTGSSLGGVQTGLKFVAKNAYEAQSGTGPAAEAFAALGVQVRDASGKLKSSETLFTEVGTALRGVRGDSERTALAMAIFGRSGQQLLPMFLDAKGSIADLMAEAKKLGLVMSTEAAEKADDFGDSLDRLKSISSMAFTNIGIVAIPMIQSLVGGITDATSWFSRFSQEHPTMAQGLVMVAGGAGLILSTLGPLLFILPSLVAGWELLTAAETWNTIASRSAAVWQWVVAGATKAAGWWATASAVQWSELSLALIWQTIAARASSVASWAAGVGAVAAGAWAAVSSLGWVGLATAIWGGVAASWAFVASPVGLVILAALAAILLVIRACKMGAEAWKAWHEAREGKKRGERQQQSYADEGIVTRDVVAEEMGLKKKWESGTLSADEQARFDAEYTKRSAAAREARKKSGAAGDTKGNWYDSGDTAAQGDTTEKMGNDYEKMKRETDAMKKNMGVPPADQTSKGGQDFGPPTAAKSGAGGGKQPGGELMPPTAGGGGEKTFNFNFSMDPRFAHDPEVERWFRRLIREEMATA